MMKQSLTFGSIALATLVLFAVNSSAEQAPAAKHRVELQSVFGAEPRQWVFIITSPSGSVGVTTPQGLRKYVELTVPEQATLEWGPGCCRIGGEPMQSAEDLEAFAAFCKQRKINFVRIPAG